MNEVHDGRIVVTDEQKAQIREQWARRVEGETLELPSGPTVLVRNVSLMGLVESGRIPNTLLGMTQKMLEDDNDNLRDPEQVKEMAALARVLVCEAVVFPKIVVASNGLEPNYPDEIAFSDLSDSDIVAIVDWAQRGVKRLASFREEQESADQAGPDSAKVLAEAVRSATEDGSLGGVPSERTDRDSGIQG